MGSVLRLRKLCFVEPVKFQSFDSIKNAEKQQQQKERIVSEVENVVRKNGGGGGGGGDDDEDRKKRKKGKRKIKEWRCIDWCCWIIGCLCSVWWLLLFLYHWLPASLPGFQLPESPGARLSREGVQALHPVVLVPGISTGGLELWEGKPCSEGLFRKRLWGGSFTEILKRNSTQSVSLGGLGTCTSDQGSCRPLCWLEHLSLDNETGLDPPGIRVRAVPGLVAADYFAPGYFVWAVLIQNLAKIGYEEKNLHMAAYDWRLSFQNTEIRDRALSRLKSTIEFMYLTNGCKKVVVVPHSMGVLYFLHFLKWVEVPRPMGGSGGPGWCAKHIKAIMNIGPPFLGVPKAVSNLLSSEGKDVAIIRAMDPGVLDSEILGLQTLEHAMRMARTWDSIISLVPKGGETIWGDLDWSPEEGHGCSLAKRRTPQSSANNMNSNHVNGKRTFSVMKDPAKYGRMISFGKEASYLPSLELPSVDLKALLLGSPSAISNSTCREVWTEYDELSRESIRDVADNKVYTSRTLLDLLRFVAPKMMQRAEAHFSHGIADNLDDPKYDHYKYWSNPLEMQLPDAPDMEIYCLYGVGIPTERSYVYKMAPTGKCKSIPFRIDSTAEGYEDSCLKGGIYFVDGDESVPVLSSGFMCARGWRGKTRFNPSGATTYAREYQHRPPASLLEGRGAASGAHVDIMGNVAFIEDVLRVAAGATGKEIGGDRIYSDIMRISERINIRL